MIRYVLAFIFVGLSYAQNAFQSLEGVVGYIVVEKGGKVENYLVIEDKGGSVKTVKVDKKPSDFLKKTEEGGRR
ncbi:MAG: hypothetical protein ACK4LT_05205 [Aquificaceae bacterium]